MCVHQKECKIIQSIPLSHSHCRRCWRTVGTYTSPWATSRRTARCTAATCSTPATSTVTTTSCGAPTPSGRTWGARRLMTTGGFPDSLGGWWQQVGFLARKEADDNRWVSWLAGSNKWNKIFENLLQYNFLKMQVLLSREAEDACQINKSFISKWILLWLHRTSLNWMRFWNSSTLNVMRLQLWSTVNLMSS